MRNDACLRFGKIGKKARLDVIMYMRILICVYGDVDTVCSGGGHHGFEEALF